MRGWLYEVTDTFVIIRFNRDLITTKLARKCMLDKIMFLYIDLQFILYMITRGSKIVLHEI